MSATVGATPLPIAPKFLFVCFVFFVCFVVVVVALVFL
jgi:hypothetical protein